MSSLNLLEPTVMAELVLTSAPSGLGLQGPLSQLYGSITYTMADPASIPQDARTSLTKLPFKRPEEPLFLGDQSFDPSQTSFWS